MPAIDGRGDRARETLPGLLGADDRGQRVLAEREARSRTHPCRRDHDDEERERPPLPAVLRGERDGEAAHERDVDLDERAGAEILQHLAGAGAVARPQQLDQALDA